jgi:hypothetical protein
MSNTTRKHPRTLNEAFGPYTSRDFDHQDPMPAADRVVIGVCAACAAILVIMVSIGWLA